MLYLLILWFAPLVALIVFAVGRPREGGALTLAYFLGLSLIHVPGVLTFLGQASGLVDRDKTEVGFELTLLGMVAFVSGAVLANWIKRSSGRPKIRSGAMQVQAFERVGWQMLAAGIVSYFVLIPFSFSVPSLTAVVLPFATLMIVGLWLRLYGATLAHDPRRTLLTLALLPLLPLATLVSGGFIGYGIYWVLSIVTFLFVIVRQRTWFYLAAPVVVFLSLSLFVTYMGQREGIRDLVWQQHAGLSDRLVRVSTIITDFQFLDLDSREHVTQLDGRLNQNYLVGAAVRRHQEGLSGFAYGATVPLWAFVPRAIWPDKPDIGGGLQVVTDFTGIPFAAGTSVGAGQVLEFYVNFGVPGVLAGFAGLGFLLMMLDHGIMRALAAGDARGLLLHAMPGLTLLQPGGNLLEIIVAAVAALIGAYVIRYTNLFKIRTTTRADWPLASNRS